MGVQERCWERAQSAPFAEVWGLVSDLARGFGSHGREFCVGGTYVSQCSFVIRLSELRLQVTDGKYGTRSGENEIYEDMNLDHPSWRKRSQICSVSPMANR